MYARMPKEEAIGRGRHVVNDIVTVLYDLAHVVNDIVTMLYDLAPVYLEAVS